MYDVSLKRCAQIILWSFSICLLINISNGIVYTDHWAVHIEGGEEVAQQLAAKHGFQYISKIMPDYYSFRHNHVSKRSLIDSFHHHKSLEQEDKVHWLEQQVVKSRVKRSTNMAFDDPKWPRMWYLNRGRGIDMNVQEAWSEGYTGKGVVVSILDDGIERDHPDLKDNYDAQASYDVNSHDSDPQPRYNYNNENRHGTRCAGEVAANANNTICSVGVAYGAGIGGVRMLDGDVTDAVEAESLSLSPNHIDIYSASWGPDDDGGTVDGPAMLARKAFYDGITKGRNGKGSIFIWASGNGGREGDNCNCDGYTNSIYTLSISSATENGKVPWYSEACSSTLASTYSSGSTGERQVVTTDLRKSCTETHTGTSASAPIAAGICALALQANPSLTWRDMQHIVVLTARPQQLNADDWVVNGNGRQVSHHFGYGIMDATAMVRRARTWTTVPSQHRCEIRSRLERSVEVKGHVQVTLQSDGCASNARNSVLYLEHVQAIISLTAVNRGGVEIYLTSPMGTKSTLLKNRRNDHSREGFSNWAFMTTHNWGETSQGQWTLEIHNSDTVSELRSWAIKLYGTATPPQPGQQVPQNNPWDDTDTVCPEGQYALKSECLVKCPPHYYGRDLLVAVDPLKAPNTNSTFHTQPPAVPSTLAEGTSPTLNSSQSHPADAIPSVIPLIISREAVKTRIAQVCHPCFSGTCVTCTGGHPNQCTQCVQGYQLSSRSDCIEAVPPSTTPHTPRPVDGIRLIMIGASAVIGVLVVVFTIMAVCYYRCGKHREEIRSGGESTSPLLHVGGEQPYRDEESEGSESYEVENEGNEDKQLYIPYSKVTYSKV